MAVAMRGGKTTPSAARTEIGVKKRDVLGLLASSLLLVMAWLDADWRWFWVAAAIVMLTWYALAPLTRR